MEARVMKVMNMIFKPEQAKPGLTSLYGDHELRKSRPRSLDEPALLEKIQNFFYALIERLRVWH